MSPFSVTSIVDFKSQGVYRLTGRSFHLDSAVEGNITKSINPNGNNQMTSDIIVDEVSNLHCQDIITEEVRLWRDNNTLVIWSCVDDGHGSEHDEAALLFEYYEKIMEHGKQPDALKVKAMNDSARKYLSDTFVDTIDWSRDGRFNLTSLPYLHVPDECLSKGSAVKELRKSLKNKKPEMTSRNQPTSYYWVGIFPVVFLAFICIALWFNKEEETPTESQQRVERIQVLEIA